MPPRKKKKTVKDENSYDAEELANLGIFIDNNDKNAEDDEEESQRDCS